jgi:UDP-N-acetyl-D-mannosaminuronic acid dehydrogenase
MKKDVRNKIKDRSARVMIFGLGYIGLPLASAVLRAGFEVTGVDTDPKIIAAIREGKTKLNRSRVTGLLNHARIRGRLNVTSECGRHVAEADIIIVCVPTPISTKDRANLNYVKNVCRKVARTKIDGKLIICESTLPPLTTVGLIGPMLEGRGRLRCGRDFWLCYCPERLTPSESLEDFVATSRIVGGYNEESAMIAAEFYATFVRGQLLRTDATTAEIAKTAENTFRDVNIAFANELALICELLGADITKVIEMTNTHPRVNIHFPGPGVGGPCLTKDPYLLLSPAESRGFKSKIIRTSRMINDLMPHHAIQLVLKSLHNINKPARETKIAVLGISYKANVSDFTSSPAKIIIEELVSLGFRVKVYDPLCPNGFGTLSATSIQDAVRGTDCIVICTDHDIFRKMDLAEVVSLMNCKPTIVDTRRAISPERAKKAGFSYYGIGLCTPNAAEKNVRD